MLGAGKTTLANYIAARLKQVGRHVEVLDEEDLGEVMWQEFEGSTKDERVAIHRRLAFLADMLTRNGVCVLVASTSPYKASRDETRRFIQRYIEVYVDCPTEDLIKRDTTGRYKKALGGEIPNFVGITEPYEPPTNAEVIVHSNIDAVDGGGLKIFQSLLDLAYMTTDELKVITGTKMKVSPPKPKKGAKPAKAPKKAAKPAKAKAKPKRR
jgi:adenylylsulfate kinase